ncbi:MAG: aminotransferase [Eggerthellaceae bacterium]|nr:aminotransferase [Eggerthellaceae bacterium]
MPHFADLSKEAVELELEKAREDYAIFKAKGLALNMARGKPARNQLELSLEMLDILDSEADLFSEDGTDCCNYGVLDGIPEAKRLMAALLDDDAENVIVLGNSSLTAMYDAIARCVNFGTVDGSPWNASECVKWLCPVPGYDRHFAITEAFGFEMIPVPMDENGPDMDMVERLVAEDESIKGIWCVPKYSNPGGTSYSDDVVRRLAEMDCAAPDFRIFWDNAYAVHHLYDDPANQDELLDIAEACAEAGTPDRYFKFGSTSKITIPGAGLAAMAASPDNIALVKEQLGVQAIGHDKLNQLRHVRFLHDGDGIAAHMSKHAEIIRPKFECVLEKLQSGLAESGIGSWSRPRGGYFVSFNAPEGCAKRIVSLAKEAGVVMTGAGSTWPYGLDPLDSNIRIAPTLPPLAELEQAMDVFVCCAKIAYAEKLLAGFEGISL